MNERRSDLNMATKTTKGQQARRWVFTLNNYTPEEEAAVKELECEWLIFGHEHQTEGTPHLQGAIVFKKRIKLTGLKKLIPRAHFEVMRGKPSESKEYCTKEDKEGYFEKGEMPKEQTKAATEANQEKWEDAIIAAKKGRFEDIPADLWTRYMRTYKQIYEDNKQDPDMDDYGDKDLKNHFLWLWGPTGTGKSHSAHAIAKKIDPDEAPYIKDLNKWWNGFTKQKVVIIEEADPKRCEHLASYFKKWADKWAFTAEAKGTVFPSCRPEYIIVTSNYTIRECFPEESDYLPLERRFTEIHLNTKKYQVIWPKIEEDGTGTNTGDSDNVLG
uniref:Replication-associated protein n=1 Tax=Cressdnaviricota sp. TaxID=2748378 RepID=A0A6M3YP91_9VIRU|nr:MAG: replicase [Cressdnaviricota sp.]